MNTRAMIEGAYRNMPKAIAIIATHVSAASAIALKISIKIALKRSITE